MILPFPPFAPDVSNLNGVTTSVAVNCVPRADGYGPFKAFTSFTAALPTACRGYFRAIKSDGTPVIFAGTSTRLFKLNNTDYSWVPSSKVTALTSISNGSPAVFTLNSHGLSNGDTLVLSTSGTLPTGLTAGTVYYVINSAANTFNVSLTSGGSAVNTSSGGSGTHSMTYFYTALSTNAQWQFAQFGNYVIAVQANIAPQVFDLSSDSAFSDLGGSPPQAAYITVVNRFVVLSGLLNNPYRIQWSGLNAVTTWTSGTNSSDYQDLPDGGRCQGVAGGEFGFIFQETTIRRMVYSPGSAVIFTIERVAQDEGLNYPYSLISAGNVVYFISSSGLRRIATTGGVEAIGKETMDRTFLDDVDTAALGLVIGAKDPQASRIYWAYKSLSGSSGAFDKIVNYDFALERFGGTISTNGEYIASTSRPGLTLDALDSISGSLDALPYASLDDVSTASLLSIAAFDTDHKLGFFTGSNLEATIQTAEQELEGGRRVRVKGLRPITDAAGCYGAVVGRENPQDSTTTSTEQVVNIRGLCPANTSTRLVRGQLRVPAAATWTYAKGMEPQWANEGKA